MGNSMEIKQRKKAKQVLFYILCIALSIVFIFPLVYMVVSSFKTDDQIVKDMSSIAAFIPYGELSVQNYQDVFEKLNFFKYFTNSMTISLCSVAIGTIINAMMGYVLGMLQFKGKKLLFAAILAFMIVPNESIIINRFLVVNNLNMVNTLFGLMVPWLAMPMYIYYSETILSGQPKKRRLPPHIFQAFYLAQPKGLCGNYRHFPAKRF